MITKIIPLWVEKIFLLTQIFWNVLMIILWHIVWSILVNVLCAHKKKKYILLWYSLFNNSIRSSAVFIFTMSSYPFRLSDFFLAIIWGKEGGLKSLTELWICLFLLALSQLFILVFKLLLVLCPLHLTPVETTPYVTHIFFLWNLILWFLKLHILVFELN